MKVMKVFSIVLTLILAICVCHAESVDATITQMTDAELYDLLDKVNAELDSRNELQLKNSISLKGFYAAEYTMSSFFDIDSSGSENEHIRINNDYFATISSGIRMITYNGRIVKVSALLNLSDTSSSIYRMYMLTSILEYKLFNKDRITDEDKHNAFELAEGIVNGALDSVGYESLQNVIDTGREGYASLAVVGNYLYNWEFINGNVWLSAEIVELPKGIY